jgi:hypothetical protein
MDWQYLKSKVYFLDGSLRDIYVHNTTKSDWQLWADFVNANYETSFYIYENEVEEKTIALSKIFDYWDGLREYLSTATVYLDHIQINVHFFVGEEIENDISPKEIHSIDDHNRLINYMTRLSKVLDKVVVLTPENQANFVLISVDKDVVKIKNY